MMDKELIVKKMEKYLLELEPKLINKEQEYCIDVENTGFHIDFIKIQEIYIETINGGSSVSNRKYKIGIRYEIGNSTKDYYYYYIENSMEGVARYILEFGNSQKICMDCGLIIDKDNKCIECEFFKIMSEYRGLTNVLCSICQDVAVRTMLPCGHYFHYVCLLQLEKKNLKCPNCRCPVPTYVCERLWEEKEDSDDEY